MDAVTVGLLVICLSDPRHHVRERTTAYIDSRGTLALPLLLCLQSSPEPDVRHRCQRLLERRRSERIYAFLHARVPTPYLDSLIGCGVSYDEYRCYRDGAEAFDDDGAGPWWRDRVALRLWAADQLAAGVCPARLTKLLDLAAVRSRYYDANGCWPPELPPE